MRTAHLPTVTVRAMPPDVSTVKGVIKDKLEQVSSDGHQMSLAGGQFQESPCLMSEGRGVGAGQGGGEGVLYSEVHCIMGNGHMGTSQQSDKQTPVKTLPFRNFVGGL